MKTSFKFIFKSGRLKSLLLYSGIVWAIHCLIGEYKDSILIDIGTSSTIIGIIAAILGIVSGIASKKQVEFHNIFRNKSLGIIAISMAVSTIIVGLIVIIKLPFAVEVVVITIAFLIIVFMLLKYMKTRVGLKLEEYKKEEIEIEIEIE